MEALQRLWTGSQPAPSTIFEYMARVAIQPGELDEYRAARARWTVALDLSQQIANRLFPRNALHIGGHIQRLQDTLNPAYCDELLAAIREDAHQQAVRTALAGTWQAFSDASGVPFMTLVREYPHLRQNVAALVGRMLARLNAEKARIDPLEAARMQAKAVADALSCGLKAADARTSQESRIIERFNDFLQTLSRTVTALKQNPGIAVEGMQVQWWARTIETLDGIITHLPAQAGNDTPAADPSPVAAIVRA